MALNEIREPKWEDRLDQYSEAILAAHPTFGNGTADRYFRAMEMVGNRHSKAAIVDLVNWLLSLSDPEPGREP